MKTGPLRRVVGSVGLAALAPTAYMLAADLITPADAAVRAAATLAVVIVVGRLATWWLSATASAFERTSEGAPQTPAATASTRTGPAPAGAGSSSATRTATPGRQDT